MKLTPVDVDLAFRQWEGYVAALRGAGWETALSIVLELASGRPASSTQPSMANMISSGHSERIRRLVAGGMPPGTTGLRYEKVRC